MNEMLRVADQVASLHWRSDLNGGYYARINDHHEYRITLEKPSIWRSHAIGLSSRMCRHGGGGGYLASISAKQAPSTKQS
jgi:hypothetical protein